MPGLARGWGRHFCLCILPSLYPTQATEKDGGGGAEQWVWGWALGDGCVPHVGGQRVAHRDGKVLLHPEAEWVS